MSGPAPAPQPTPHAGENSSQVSSGVGPRATSWAEVVRLRTLPAAVAPVILGAGAAGALGAFSFPRTLLAAGVALALQIGCNLANDYSDGVRGTDDDRSGPPRLTASGALKPKAVKYAAFGCFGIAGILGLILLALSGQWWLLAVGVAAVAAAWFYTGGSHPYGYAGLGEIFVFIFFGLVATAGTVYVQANSVPAWVWFGATGIGLIACALLMVNNLRDIHTDPAHGKMTLAVRLGEKRARAAYRAMLVAPIMLALVMLTIARGDGRDNHGGDGTFLGGAVVGLIFLLVLSVPASKADAPVRDGAEGRDLIPALRNAGLYELVYGVACAAALIAITAA